jgi:hypothetical protein
MDDSAAMPCWPKPSEALFVDTLRRYVAGLPEQQTGWLTGARDPIVGKSIGLLHSRIAPPWTIVELVDELGISRTALVERTSKPSASRRWDVLVHIKRNRTPIRTRRPRSCHQAPNPAGQSLDRPVEAHCGINGTPDPGRIRHGVLAGCKALTVLPDTLLARP